jgi:hypothetical protein
VSPVLRDAGFLTKDFSKQVASPDEGGQGLLRNIAETRREIKRDLF